MIEVEREILIKNFAKDFRFKPEKIYLLKKGRFGDNWFEWKDYAKFTASVVNAR